MLSCKTNGNKAAYYLNKEMLVLQFGDFRNDTSGHNLLIFS